VCVRVAFVRKQQCITHPHARSPRAIVCFWAQSIISRIAFWLNVCTTDSASKVAKCGSLGLRTSERSPNNAQDVLYKINIHGVKMITNSVLLVNLWNQRAEYVSFEVNGSMLCYKNFIGFIRNPEISAMHNNKQWRTSSNYYPIPYSTSPTHPLALLTPLTACNPKVHYRLHNSPQPFSIRSQIRPVYATHPIFWRSILILSPRQCLGLLGDSFPRVSPPEPRRRLSSPLIRVT
jgi:hypothetical protein